MDEMKQEMIEIASMMAGKVVAASIDTTIQDALVEETLKEMQFLSFPVSSHTSRVFSPVLPLHWHAG